MSMVHRVWCSGVVLAVVGAAAAFPSVAEACSCVPPSVSASWHQSSDTLRGRVLSHKVVGDTDRYLVEVLRPFSGCSDRGDQVLIETPRSEAACGIDLDVGETYLLTADGAPGERALGIGLCGYNVPWSSLSASDLEFLASRPVVCDSEPGVVSCGDGSAPVQCFANSCEVETACAEAVTCEFNTCGGCDAEFYDESWTAVCEP